MDCKNPGRKKRLLAIVVSVLLLALLLFFIAGKKSGVPVESIKETTTEEMETVAEIIETMPDKETDESSTDSSSTDSSSTDSSLAEYILPESSSRHYTAEELSALTPVELRLARNEIYARHGRRFSAEDLQAYFSGTSWYTPIYDADVFDAKSDDIFNEYERGNLNLIVELENSRMLDEHTAITSLINEYSYAQGAFTVDILDLSTGEDKGDYYEFTANLYTDIIFPASEIEKKQIGDSILVIDEWYEITDIDTSEFNKHWKYYTLDDPHDDVWGIGKSSDSGIYTALGAGDYPVQTKIYSGPVRILKGVAITILYGGHPDEKVTRSIEDFFRSVTEDTLYARWLIADFDSAGYITKVEEQWVS